MVRQLSDHAIEAVILAGGEGTMALLDALAEASLRWGVPVAVIGIPKTIDNDLHGVDFSPGFPSAVNFLTMALRNLSQDHVAMSDVEPVRIIETMGRDTGWLAASAVASHTHSSKVIVDACIIPEASTQNEQYLLGAIEAALSTKSRAFVVCSEGAPFGDQRQHFSQSNHAQLLEGGVSKEIAGMVQREFKCPARAIVLGPLQRSAAEFATHSDGYCARLVGERAGELFLEGMSRAMVGTHRFLDEPLQLATQPHTLATIAGRRRTLPEEFHPRNPSGLDELNLWLSPLLSSRKDD